MNKNRISDVNDHGNGKTDDADGDERNNKKENKYYQDGNDDESAQIVDENVKNYDKSEKYAMKATKLTMLAIRATTAIENNNVNDDKSGHNNIIACIIALRKQATFSLSAKSIFIQYPINIFLKS